MSWYLAIDNRVTVVGTGINPGFVLDLLVIALTGVCWWVDSITAQRTHWRGNCRAQR
jgi:4-hydroxy-tetrahydrodipicolinate reductase